MDERQQTGLVYALSEIAMSLKFERNMNRLETEQYPVEGTPLNPFENEVDLFTDDMSNPPLSKTELHLAQQYETLLKEHNELLSVIAPLKDFSEEVLSSFGAYCIQRRSSDNEKFITLIGDSKAIDGFYVRIGEVVDRINEWYNGR